MKPTMSSILLLIEAVKPSFIAQADIVIVLSITVFIFFVLLIVGLRKTYKLQEESRKLNANPIDDDDETKPYKDFTEGHLYES